MTRDGKGPEGVGQWRGFGGIAGVAEGSLPAEVNGEV